MVFFFSPEGTFDIANMAESPGLDRDGHLHQEGEDKEADCPDSKGDHEFQKVRDIGVDLAERIWDKPRDDEPRSLFNPDPCDDKETAYVQNG